MSLDLGLIRVCLQVPQMHDASPRVSTQALIHDVYGVVLNQFPRMAHPCTTPCARYDTPY